MRKDTTRFFKNPYFWLYSVLYFISGYCFWNYGWKLVVGVWAFGSAMRAEDIFNKGREID